VIFWPLFLRQSDEYPVRGDNKIMATKQKTAKTSAPRDVKLKAKKVLTMPVPEKSVSKANKVAITPKEAIQEKVPKLKKTVLKVKPAPIAIPTEPIIENVPKTSAKKMSPQKKLIDKSPVPELAVVMKEQKWLEIRAILEKLKDETLLEIRKSVKNSTEAVAAIEPSGDIYDQASSERDRELGLLLGDREREKIHSIDEALLRIDDGEYGICEECDEDIPLGRLKAMPFTRHCVKCKSDLEKMQAQTKRVEEERAYREIPMGADDEES
jgi:DnaK suppressor protein